jgi:hypothetical protein
MAFRPEASRAQWQDVRHCTRDPSWLKPLGMTPGDEVRSSKRPKMGSERCGFSRTVSSPQRLKPLLFDTGYGMPCPSTKLLRTKFYQANVATTSISPTILPLSSSSTADGIQYSMCSPAPTCFWLVAAQKWFPNAEPQNIAATTRSFVLCVPLAGDLLSIFAVEDGIENGLSGQSRRKGATSAVPHQFKFGLTNRPKQKEKRPRCSEATWPF